MNPKLPNRIRFGQIQRGQKFRYHGKTWQRTRGTFALPAEHIGQGQCGWRINPAVLVETISSKPTNNPS